MVVTRDIMDQTPSGFYLSSGRRERRSRSGRLIVIGVLFIVGLVVVFELGRDDEVPAPTAPAPVAPTVTATASPTATGAPSEFSTDVVLVAPTLTPTPWIPAAPRSPKRPQPTTTPSAAQCVRASWDAHQSLAAWGNVLVNISATNTCRRVLQPTDVWFRVSGFRDGGLVQTAQGSPFEEIYPGRTTRFGIGLPGSIDWYDEIVVEVND
jgi:hypothetical protein